MNKQLTGGIAAGSLAIGILMGAAGTIVVRDATTDAFTAHMTSDMGGPTTADMGSMMSMMSGSMGQSGPGMMVPGGSAAPIDPSDHDGHHALPSPEATK